MVGILKEDENGQQLPALRDACVRRKGVGVVATHAQGRSAVPYEATQPLHYPLQCLPLSHVV